MRLYISIWAKEKHQHTFLNPFWWWLRPGGHGRIITHRFANGRADPAVQSKALARYGFYFIPPIILSGLYKRVISYYRLFLFNLLINSFSIRTWKVYFKIQSVKCTVVWIFKSCCKKILKGHGFLKKQQLLLI